MKDVFYAVSLLSIVNHSYNQQIDALFSCILYLFATLWKDTMLQYIVYFFVGEVHIQIGRVVTSGV